MLSLAHAGTAVASAFLASLVEAVEALTIVLAVGTVRGWRPALAGTLAGVEMGLEIAGVPHRKGGVAAAMEHLAAEAQRSRKERAAA